MTSQDSTTQSTATGAEKLSLPTLAAMVVSQPDAASTAERNPNLSYTGFPTEPLAISAAALMAIGTAMLILAGRRRAAGERTSGHGAGVHRT